MLQDTHDKVRPILERRDHGFRWRGKEISRIEGLSDAVFAFAVTLLVVSLEAPKRFEELMHMMHGFVTFAICFAMLIMIWHAQYVYFRRYALDDGISFLLNATLLFMVAFYVYPMKFLFTLLVNRITGYHELDAAGAVIVQMKNTDWRSLMLIYSAGFTGVYAIFTTLYLHAYRMRGELELNALEIYQTRSVVQENLLMLGVGVVSLLLALVDAPRLAGMIYILIGPLQTVLGFRHGKGSKLVAAEMETT